MELAGLRKWAKDISDKKDVSGKNAEQGKKRIITIPGKKAGPTKIYTKDFKRNLLHRAFGIQSKWDNDTFKFFDRALRGYIYSGIDGHKVGAANLYKNVKAELDHLRKKGDGLRIDALVDLIDKTVDAKSHLSDINASAGLRECGISERQVIEAARTHLEGSKEISVVSKALGNWLLDAIPEDKREQIAFSTGENLIFDLTLILEQEFGKGSPDKLKVATATYNRAVSAMLPDHVDEEDMDEGVPPTKVTIGGETYHFVERLGGEVSDKCQSTSPTQETKSRSRSPTTSICSRTG
jgi:hypothetical protein